MVLIHIMQGHALNRRDSVLNLDLANVWSQYGTCIESAIVKQTSGGSAVGKPKTRNS